MRGGGLRFPVEAVLERAASYDYAPSASPQPIPIPIDPALNGNRHDSGVLDPALEEGYDTNTAPGPSTSVPGIPHPEQTYNHDPSYPSSSPDRRQYAQGPQGDPFAPQPTVPYIVEPVPGVNNEQQQRTKAPKRKRKSKWRREEECGFCQGNDDHNKDGQPEVMLSCFECGRSGHPSCMDLGEVSDVVRGYEWSCQECKVCEICREKGDDERILFCDHCDRGWHMDCMEPPISEAPEGKWHCQMCPPVGPDQKGSNHQDEDRPIEEDEVDLPSSLLPQAVLEEDQEETPVASTSRIRKPSRKSKGRALTPSDHYPSPPPPPPPRRRAAPPPPAPAPQKSRMVVRLKLPARAAAREEQVEDEGPKGMFDDILNEDERDVSKSSIESGDKQRFERARIAADAKLAPTTTATGKDRDTATPLQGPLGRPLRRSAQHLPLAEDALRSASPSTPTPGPSNFNFTPESGGLLRVKTIRFGQFDIQTWYDAPFPEEYAAIPDGRLWICEFCLKYMKSGFGCGRHRMKCKARHPPGDEIYRDGTVSIFEVDGRRNKIYCQNLCLLSKMFLDHKSLFYDVEPFLFYVMTEVDDIGARFVGYFSKEKRSPKDYNVSCIMTLPVRQRQGWGNLLIDFSYLLSKKERRLGSPEKPLSGLGALGYKNYWTLAIMRYLEKASPNPTLEDVCLATSMTVEDVYHTLDHLGFIQRSKRPQTPPVRPSPGQSIRSFRGRKSNFARRTISSRTNIKDAEASLEKPKGPFIPPKKGEYQIQWDAERVSTYLGKWDAKGYLRLHPEKLKWSPFLLSRARKTETMVEIAAEADTEEFNPFAPSPSRASNSNPQDASSIEQRRTTEDMFVEDEPTTPMDVDGDGISDVIGEPILSDDDEEYKEEEEEPAPPPIRRTRSRVSAATTITTPRRSDRRRRQSSEATSVQTMGSSTAATTRRTTRGSMRTTRQTADDDATATADEALASKLALEEDERPLRRTRSSQAEKETPSNSAKRINPSITITTNGNGSVNTRSQSSPRKRRRVDDSPEVESPTVSVSARAARRNGREAATASKAAPNGKHSQLHPIAAGRGVNGSGVKDEESGSPLAVLANVASRRQSVPSDDTLITADRDRDRQTHSIKDTGHDRIREGVILLDDGDGDIDAEGEEDAEGEDDADADEDEYGEEDAEGESDSEFADVH